MIWLEEVYTVIYMEDMRLDCVCSLGYQYEGKKQWTIQENDLQTED